MQKRNEQSCMATIRVAANGYIITYENALERCDMHRYSDMYVFNTFVAAAAHLNTTLDTPESVPHTIVPSH